jgi:biopolymer transport protein ExbD
MYYTVDIYTPTPVIEILLAELSIFLTVTLYPAKAVKVGRVIVTFPAVVSLLKSNGCHKLTIATVLFAVTVWFVYVLTLV